MEIMLITGAAGFIGNAACERYRDKFEIYGIDNCTRPTSIPPKGINFLRTDARDIDRIRLPHPNVILHLAGQASVVKSIEWPYDDFLNNAGLGLTMARWASSSRPRCFIYSSTNKVYGELPGVSSPILDSQPLNPQTPYGISKATAGLYIRDMLPGCSYDFRQSCIYSENQVGTEDQGWIGWIRNSIRKGRAITCYGDGEQVRDLLHIKDLLDAYDLAIQGVLDPGSYTVGGGPCNAVTFDQAVNILGGNITFHEPPRLHDQKYFVAASNGLRKVGWLPGVSAKEWLVKHHVATEVMA